MKWVDVLIIGLLYHTKTTIEFIHFSDVTFRKCVMNSEGRREVLSIPMVTPCLSFDWLQHQHDAMLGPEVRLAGLQHQLLIARCQFQLCLQQQFGSCYLGLQ